MYPLLAVAAASLIFMDFEVFRVVGKSIVLPYVATFALAVPVLAKPSRLTFLWKDPAFPFLLIWVGIASFSSILGYLRFYPEPYVHGVRGEMLVHDTTQVINLLMMLAQYALFVCAIRSVSSDELRNVVTLFVLVGVAGALYSLYQMGFVLFGWPYRELLRTSNLYLHAESLEPGGFGGWIRFPRAFGTAPEPSLWGAYLVVVAAFLVGSLRRGGQPGALIATAVVVASIGVTFSRSAWLTLAVVGLVGGGAHVARRVRAWILPAALMVILAVTLWPTIVVRGSTNVFEDLSVAERMSAHLTGLNILSENALFGIGLGSVRFLIDHYAVLLPGYNQIRFITVFSFYLLVFVSTGIVGAIVFWTFLWTIVTRLGRAFELSIDDEPRRLLVGTTLACLAVLVSWLNHAGYNFSFIWFALALGSSLPSRLVQ